MLRVAITKELTTTTTAAAANTMANDVNLFKGSNGIELKTISAGSYQSQSHIYNNNDLNRNTHLRSFTSSIPLPEVQPPPPPPSKLSTSSSSSSSSEGQTCNNFHTSSGSNGSGGGCCSILSRLLCSSQKSRAKTASSSSDFNNLNANALPYAGIGNNSLYTTTTRTTSHLCLARKTPHRRTPQEVYFESRGKSCKKLLKFNGNCNKILLYPEEGWARTASSSYWTITPCWWQPNRCRIEEFSGTQRQVTKAKMMPLEQKGSLLIAGHFHNDKNSNLAEKDGGEFKLYLSSNISMEDYNMGYCLTGFVERRCQPTNTFQMTHFAVIKRQWPSINNTKSNNYNCATNGYTTTNTHTMRRSIVAALGNNSKTVELNVYKST